MSLPPRRKPGELPKRLRENASDEKPEKIDPTPEPDDQRWAPTDLATAPDESKAKDASPLPVLPRESKNEPVPDTTVDKPATPIQQGQRIESLPPQRSTPAVSKRALEPRDDSAAGLASLKPLLQRQKNWVLLLGLFQIGGIFWSVNQTMSLMPLLSPENEVLNKTPIVWMGLAACAIFVALALVALAAIFKLFGLQNSIEDSFTTTNLAKIVKAQTAIFRYSVLSGFLAVAAHYAIYLLDVAS